MTTTINKNATVPANDMYHPTHEYIEERRRILEDINRHITITYDTKDGFTAEIED